MPAAGPSNRLDAYQREHGWLGFPIAVVYKFFDDQGAYLAALITYYAVVSIFPLLLLLAAVLGIVLIDEPHLRTKILSSAISQFPVIGHQIVQDPSKLGGRGVGLSVGLVGSIYGGLGAAQAAQNAMNIAWGVPRNSRPNPIRARGQSLKLVGTLGLGLVGTTVLSALASGTDSFGGAGVHTGLKVLLFGVSVALNTGIFLLGFRLATASKLAVREVALGAVIAAVVYQVLQIYGAIYVKTVVAPATDTNGVFSLVLGLIALLFLASTVVVLCVEINVVRARQLWPRALLTPFTDNVDLTAADRRAYVLYAQAQRHKGFERIEVAFADDDTLAPGPGGRDVPAAGADPPPGLIRFPGPGT